MCAYILFEEYVAATHTTATAPSCCSCPRQQQAATGFLLPHAKPLRVHSLSLPFYAPPSRHFACVLPYLSPPATGHTTHSPINVNCLNVLRVFRSIRQLSFCSTVSCLESMRFVQQKQKKLLAFAHQLSGHAHACKNTHTHARA